MISVALLHATIASGKTAYEPLPHVKGKGFALLPPPSPADVFFDMEDIRTPMKLEYCLGRLCAVSLSRIQRLVAHDRKEEQVAFEAFIDWLMPGG